MKPNAPVTLTIGGFPGTGTTTACGTLSERLGLPHLYTGALFRKLAEEYKMTLAQFGAYAEAHPEIDRGLDMQQAELLKGPPMILEGRLAGYLAFRDKRPAVKVWFTCDPYVRAQRIVGREGGTLEQRMEEMRRREESEKRRYLEYYAFDIGDLSPYDLVLDTTKLTKEEVVQACLDEYQKRTRRKWWKVWA